MESSEQEPLEENTGQQKEQEKQGKQEVEQEVQPLYEFPPENLSPNTVVVQPQPAPITQVLPLAEGAEAPSPASLDEDAIRKGLVYPPPPSFYQNMQPSKTPPILPPPAHAQPIRQQYSPVAPGVVPPPMPGQQPVPQVQQGGYPPAFPPPFVPTYERRPPVRKSRRWLWITLSIVGAVVLLTCGLCSWAAYSFFAPVVQGVSGSLAVIDDYYGDLQNKNYSAAFADINTHYQLSGLTESQFVQQASARDSQYGSILSYTPGQPAYASDPNGGFDFTRFTISVDVKRTSSTYTATLSLRKIGNDWKITNFDSI